MYEEIVSYIELVKNGKLIEQIAINDLRKQGKIATTSFSSSGWFLLRAICDTEPHRYVCAITAPYYVEIGGIRRKKSKRAADFFLEWLEAAQTQDQAKRWTQEELHRAKAFFQTIRQSANTP